jgi:hypothetical protein
MKVIHIDDDMYILRGSVSTKSSYSIDQIKRMYGVDTVLRQADVWWAAEKIIEAEFEDIENNGNK